MASTVAEKPCRWEVETFATTLLAPLEGGRQTEEGRGG